MKSTQAVFASSMHRHHFQFRNALKTSFPVSLILPPPGGNGKMRDPGNEVDALTVPRLRLTNLRTKTYFRLSLVSAEIRLRSQAIDPPTEQDFTFCLS